MSRQLRNYCFTWYGSREALDRWINHRDFRYLCAQQETCPRTARIHWQGYLEWLQPIRITTLRNLLGAIENSLHLEGRRGTQDEAIEYTRKVDTGIEGTWFEAGQRGGIINELDIKSVYTDVIVEALDMDKPISKLLLELKDNGMKRQSQIQKYYNLLREDKLMNELRNEFATIPLHPWQRAARDELLQQNNREILWIFDKHGCCGKSWFAKYLAVMHDACVATRGRSQDIIRIFKPGFHSMLVLDLTRSETTMPYVLCEEFKNGQVTSPKYESSTIYFKSIPILVMSNVAPDKTKWTEDRWRVWELQKVGEVIECEDHSDEYRIATQLAAGYRPMADADEF
jgi:hypothetical protein